MTSAHPSYVLTLLVNNGRYCSWLRTVSVPTVDNGHLR